MRSVATSATDTRRYSNSSGNLSASVEEAQRTCVTPAARSARRLLAAPYEPIRSPGSTRAWRNSEQQCKWQAW